MASLTVNADPQETSTHSTNEQAPSRPLPGQLCLCGGVEAGEQERAQAVFGEGGLMGEIQKILKNSLGEQFPCSRHHSLTAGTSIVQNGEKTEK